MKKTYLFLLVSVLLFGSCSNDDKEKDIAPPDENANKIELSVEMKYKNDKGDFIPDESAQVYCFQTFSNYVDYQYIGQGRYKHKTNGDIKNATEKGIAGKDGIAKTMVSWSYKSLIVWESNGVKGKYGQNIYEVKKDKPIKISQVYFSDTSQPTYPF